MDNMSDNVAIAPSTVRRGTPRLNSDRSGRCADSAMYVVDRADGRLAISSGESGSLGFFRDTVCID
jgi:hypothetical protein